MTITIIYTKSKKSASINIFKYQVLLKKHLQITFMFLKSAPTIIPKIKSSFLRTKFIVSLKINVWKNGYIKLVIYK